MISYNLLEQSIPPLRHTFPWNTSEKIVEAWKKEEYSRNIPSLYLDSHVLMIIHMILSQCAIGKEGKVILGELWPWLLELKKNNTSDLCITTAIKWIRECNLSTELLKCIADQGNIIPGNGIITEQQYNTILLEYISQHPTIVKIRTNNADTNIHTTDNTNADHEELLPRYHNQPLHLCKVPLYIHTNASI